MRNYCFISLIIASSLFWGISCQPEGTVMEVDSSPKVFLITLDGLRWQELFMGADPHLINDPEYVNDTAELISLFWDEDHKTRRKKLMPFFWSEIANKGVLIGNRDLNSKVNLTNTYWFSYPGYNEILTGFADEKINSNDKVNNTNETVLEFINKQDGYENRVAAFASWDVFPYIINEERSGVYVNAGFESAEELGISENEILLNKLQKEIPRTWSTVRVDAFTHHFALEHIKKNKPKVVYIAYGETDDFAHDGRYDHYLKSAKQTDDFIREMWEMIETNPEYAGKTSIIITTDHGRGTIPKESWRSHGSSISGADETWIAAIGPGINSTGELSDSSQFYQNQVAATVAALLGMEFDNNGKAGEKLDILRSE